LLLCVISNLGGSRETNQLLDQSKLFAESKATGEWIREHIPPDAALGAELMLPILHIHAASRHPVAYAPHELSKSLKFDYLLSLGAFPQDRAIGDESQAHFVVAWESPEQTFQVLRKIVPPGSDPYAIH
jgi:hypothetical protein